MKGFRYDYAIHPLANRFPDLSADEFEKLKNDISHNGQLEPIVIDGDELNVMLLDGRHRLRACEELGIQPRLLHFSRVMMESNPQLSPSDYIWSVNVLRRHLTEDQRTAIGFNWADAAKDQAKQRQKRGLRPSGESAHRSGRTRKILSEKIGVSQHKVRQAERVARMAPHLTPKIAAGAMTLREAEKTIPVFVTVQPRPEQPERIVTVSCKVEKGAEAYKVRLQEAVEVGEAKMQLRVSIDGAGIASADRSRFESMAREHLLVLKAEILAGPRASTIDMRGTRIESKRRRRR